MKARPIASAKTKRKYPLVAPSRSLSEIFALHFNPSGTHRPECQIEQRHEPERVSTRDVSSGLTTAFRKLLGVAADMTAFINPPKNPTRQIGAICVVARQERLADPLKLG